MSVKVLLTHVGIKVKPLLKASPRSDFATNEQVFTISICKELHVI